MTDPTDPPALRALIASQDGVVARWQVEAHGLRPHEIERRLRRRLWVRQAPGVYLDHTGVPTWRQRAWAAVLPCWPAALLGRSAVHAAEGAGPDDEVILVAIDRTRCRRADPPGAKVRRVVDLDRRVQWNTGPPRQRYEDAVLEVAACARDEASAVAALTRAVGSRRTTAARLSAALASLRRAPRRAFLEAVLDDIAGGVSSVLERAYLQRIERAHGLPRSRWQVRADTAAGVVYRDATYEGGAVVELDGLAHHTSREDRDADLQRDLLHAVDGGATTRLGSRQVLVDSCATTVLLVRFLRRHGVAVTPHPCGSGCPVPGACRP
ncbi:hypothetical protein [uncultured Nocardioides sp.]|uniref:hypothetical protein n=1 Tax=uncultured Nocardioides sp. TaxID=198441 RepID=UPI0026100190|nr:hypothetical protein [uncultured Nocardioides sp.]